MSCWQMSRPLGSKKKKAVEADAGAGGRQDVSASIRSSPDGQDEAIDTLIVPLRLIGGFPGGGDGSYVLLGAVGADDGAGGRQDARASIRSSPDGQDEAIDTPTTLLPSLQVHMCGLNPAFYIDISTAP